MKTEKVITIERIGVGTIVNWLISSAPNNYWTSVGNSWDSVSYTLSSEVATSSVSSTYSSSVISGYESISWTTWTSSIASS